MRPVLKVPSPLRAAFHRSSFRRPPSPRSAILLPLLLLAGCAGLPGSWPSGQATPSRPAAGALPTPAAKPSDAPQVQAPAQPAQAPAQPAQAVPVEPVGPPREEFFFAVTSGNLLVRFNAGQPARLLSSVPLSGLRTGEEILGIDFRRGPGSLYALGRTGSESRLLTIDTGSGKVAQVGSSQLLTPLIGSEFGFDFNPAADRFRVVSDTGQNLRVHPDTGAIVDTDPSSPGLEFDDPLVYEKKDRHAARRPWIAAAAHAPDRKNGKLATHYAIDAMAGTLVVQGSPAGAKPAVSPDAGRLRTVGPLGIGSAERIGFDVADQTGAAFIAVTRPGSARSTFHLLDLSTGRTTFLGTIGGGEPVRGISAAP